MIIKSKNILINYKTANLKIKHIKMLDFAYKLTSSSHFINDMIEIILRKAKFSENHILEIIEVCCIL